jgi:hypothetical protein
VKLSTYRQAAPNAFPTPRSRPCWENSPDSPVKERGFEVSVPRLP